MITELTKPKLIRGYITYYAKYESTKDEYGVCIKINTDGTLSNKSNCNCLYGSYHRDTQKNKKDKWICRHIFKVYSKIIRETQFKTKQRLIEEGILNKDHLQTI